MSLCPRSELDPELDSQKMVQLQLAPSVVILIRVDITLQSFTILLCFSSAVSLITHFL